MKKVWLGTFLVVGFISYALIGRSPKKTVLTEEEKKTKKTKKKKKEEKIEEKLDELEMKQAKLEEKHHSLLQRQKSGVETLDREVEDVLYRFERIQKDIALLERRKNR